MQKKSIQVAAAAIVNAAGKVLIAKRPDDKHQGGKWEFPGGKVEAGESILQALTRELDEELSIQVTTACPLIQITYEYPEKIVHLDVWLVTEFSGVPVGNEGQAIQWVKKSALKDYEFPPANRPIIQALLLPNAYLITGEFSDQVDCFQRVQRAVESDIKLIQLRVKEKTLSLEFIKELAGYCQEHQAQLFVKQSDVSNIMFKFSGIGGIHLTAAELLESAQSSISKYRKQGWLVAASCHNTKEITKANSLNIDFVTLSPVQSTDSHPSQPSLGWEKAQQLIKQAHCPVYCLGGLGLSDIEQIKQVGGQGVAGISQFWPAGGYEY